MKSVFLSCMLAWILSATNLMADTNINTAGGYASVFATGNAVSGRGEVTSESSTMAVAPDGSAVTAGNISAFAGFAFNGQYAGGGNAAVETLSISSADNGGSAGTLVVAEHAAWADVLFGVTGVVGGAEGSAIALNPDAQAIGEGFTTGAKYGVDPVALAENIGSLLVEVGVHN